jgi:preprotein translocase SecE subunit
MEMATAVQTSSEPRTPNPRVRLALASLFGAAFVIAGVVVAAYLIPQVWAEYVSPVLAPLGRFVDVALRLVAQVAAAGAIIWLGTRLAGANPPRGLRGGIFLAISTLVTIFFLVRAVGLNVEGMDFGGVITAVFLGVMVGLGYKFLTSARAERWMVALEEQGWFHTNNYKRTQGIRVRRYTLLGILLIGWTGVYAVYNQQTFGTGNWSLSLPFLDQYGLPRAMTVLSDVEYAAPVLLAALTFWVAWRAVNVPTFADFLVATEAEMNKVSWSSRRRLTQDTIVVLVTVAQLTAFLLVVDLFWGWLLSRELIGVLPPRSNTQGVAADPLEGKNIDW